MSKLYVSPDYRIEFDKYGNPFRVSTLARPSDNTQAGLADKDGWVSIEGQAIILRALGYLRKELIDTYREMLDNYCREGTQARLNIEEKLKELTSDE